MWVTTPCLVGGNMGIKKKKFGDRKDGIWVKSGPDAYIRTLSVSQQSRQRSIYKNERIDLENVNRYLAEKE